MPAKMRSRRSRSAFDTAAARARRRLAGLVRFGQHPATGADLWLKEDTLATHMQVIGGTKTGKTFFLEQLARQLMALPQHRSVIVLDPHGSLYYRLMDYCVDRQEAERVIFFNPTADPIIGYNPVRRIGQAPPYYQAVMALEACRKVWGDEAFERTPRLNRWLYNSFMATLESGYTMQEQLYMLNPLQDFDPQRRQILANITDEFVRSDWEWFLRQRDTIREERTESSANRLKMFVNNGDVQNIVGRQQRVLDLDAVVREGKILLVNLAAHEGARLTPEHTSLLGTLLVNDILAACFRRPRREREANPAYLILDEFQHFTTKDICVILNEGRKFGLHLILAHHHLGPIKERDPEVYYSVLTNATTKVVFGGISEDDAATFARQLFRFNLDERKLELYAPYDRPQLEWVDIITEQEGSAWHSGVASAITSGEAFRPDTGFFGDELIGKTKGEAEHRSSAEAGSKSRSVTRSPLTTYVHEERLSSVQFRQLDEQVRRAEEALMDQPTQHALIKVRGKPVTFFKVPTLKTLWVRDSERQEYKDRIIAATSCYATLIDIRAEREDRRRELGLLKPTPKPGDKDDRYPDDKDY